MAESLVHGVCESVAHSGEHVAVRVQGDSYSGVAKELGIADVKFPTRQAAKTAIFEYLETFYNARWLHSALGYKSPANSASLDLCHVG